MRIRMLVNVTDASGSYERGQVVDLAAAEAERLVGRGRAVLVEGILGRQRVSTETETRPPIESAALAPPAEAAVAPAPRRKRKGN